VDGLPARGSTYPKATTIPALCTGRRSSSAANALAAGIPVHLGRLPVGILWFGGIGGSIVSFTGIFWHNRAWDESHNYWHALRPLIGVVTGGVGCLLLLATAELATRDSKALNPDVYYAVAFVVGFAEATFRDLIKRLTDVLFGPGKTAPKTDTTGHVDS
jgi:hypothetical protein